MKKTNYLSIIVAVLVICTLFIPSNVNATQSIPTTKDIIRLENGDYLETTITSSPVFPAPIPHQLPESPGL